MGRERAWGAVLGLLVGPADTPWLLLGGAAVLVSVVAAAVTGIAVRSRLPMVARAAG